MYLDLTQRSTTVDRTLLDDWPFRRRDLYLTAHKIQKRRTSMTWTGIEPAVLANQQLHTHVLDRAATGIGLQICLPTEFAFERRRNKISRNE
jgi:hypothetical protein